MTITTEPPTSVEPTQGPNLDYVRQAEAAADVIRGEVDELVARDPWFARTRPVDGITVPPRHFYSEIINNPYSL